MSLGRQLNFTRHKKTSSDDSRLRFSESDHNVGLNNCNNLETSPEQPQLQTPDNVCTRRAAACRVILDLTCCLMVFLPWVILHICATPYPRGFFCDDVSLQYPYYDSTVSSTVLVAGGFVVGLIIISFTELTVDLYDHFYTRKEIQMFLIGGSSIPRSLIECYKVQVMYAFGCAVQQTAVNIMKYAVGSLRPHFFDICKPDFSQIQCTSNETGAANYVMDYTCTGSNEQALWDMHLSFPSGHASIAMYFGVFLAMYLQARMLSRRSHLFKHVIQAFLLWLAVWISLTRITDNKHHATDVFSGGLIGTVFAVLAVVQVRRLLWSEGGYQPLYSRRAVCSVADSDSFKA